MSIIYTAFHIKLPFLELDYTASAKCQNGISHSLYNQAPKKDHLMKSGIARYTHSWIGANPLIAMLHIERGGAVSNF
jgi:hypothetical protein